MFFEYFTSVLLFVCGVQETPFALSPQASEDSLGVTEAHVFEGRVLRADGSAARGALVVTSAGGRTATDRSGFFRLSVAVPIEATSVQVTAVATEGASSLVASSKVELASSLRSVVDPLRLVAGADCPRGWLPRFGQFPGVDSTVDAMAVFDDGSGPALYVAGGFGLAGSLQANRIAKWDGSRWSALGSGMNANVYALAVYDAGSGPALYAGGEFWIAGGVTVNRVARWDGTTWSALGSGMNVGSVLALAVFDSGSGPALYAGGSFSMAGGHVANRIAKWDGASWSALGSGCNDAVRALAVYDDGGGSKLYVGGSFTIVDGVGSRHLGRWSGAAWVPASDFEVFSDASGIPAPARVLALQVHDDGSGPALFIGGDFLFAEAGFSGLVVNNVAKWNGSWSALENGSTRDVRALSVYDDGSGPALVAGIGADTQAGGADLPSVARWNGSTWSAVDGGIGGIAGALAVYQGALYVGGGFSTAGTEPALSIARWDQVWSALETGPNSSVLATTVHDDGSGPALYVGGSFTHLGGVRANFIAKADGTSWSPLDAGLDHASFSNSGYHVDVMTTFDDGSGPALFVGGQFDRAGADDLQALCVAKWNGTEWSALGTGVGANGVNGEVLDLCVFDDGGGPALYVAGFFTVAGGSVAANRIARWDGTSWSALGSGMNDAVAALAVFDDGSGPALYAAGYFTTAGGVPANYLARWNGASWSSLGTTTSGGVRTMTVFDDGGGPALCVGGTFVTAGGLPANRVASWDGTNWTALGTGVNGPVHVLRAMDDGSGTALYIGGAFTVAGGLVAQRIARWDGSSWSAMGSGMNGTVRALAVHEEGLGTALVAGGEFTNCTDSADSYLAQWACPLVLEKGKTRLR